jgi:hypothetical protein
MASPSEAEIQTQFGNAVEIEDEFLAYIATNADNYLLREDELVQSLETDFAPEAMAGVQAFRSQLNAALAQAANVLNGHVLTYGKFINAPEKAASAILDRLYQNFVDNSKTVKSRQFTFANPVAAGGNVGNGVILRLNKDQYNFDIENQFPDSKTAICIADAQTGAVKHEENFEFRAGQPGKDLLQLAGSGLVAQFRAKSARDSNALLSNPSFSQYSGTVTNPTAITDWTVTTAIANFQIDTVNFYRDFEGDTAPAALRIETNDKITQKQTVRGGSFDKTRPYLLQVAYNRQVYAADGTLTIRLGSQSASVVLAAQTGWNLLRLAIDTNLWPKNFDVASLGVEIELSGNTTGDLLVDDVLLLPGEAFNNSWYWIIGGSTKFLLNDKFTWSDTAVDSIIQKWLWRAFNKYLPSTTGVPTWTEP